jgi:hypothetical protein
MSTDPNPYAPPRAAVADQLPPRPVRGKSLLPLWLAAGYCTVGGVLQLLLIAVFLYSMSLPALGLGFYLRLIPVLMMIGAGITLIRRSSVSPELLLAVIILRAQTQAIPVTPDSGLHLSATDIPDWLILVAITRYAYVLRARGVLRQVAASSGEEGRGSGLRAAGIYCLVPGVLHLLAVALPQLGDVSAGIVSAPSYMLAVIVAVVRVVAGVQVLRGSSRSPQALILLCGLSVLRVAVPAFRPSYLPMPGLLLLPDLAVLGLITYHVFGLRRRGVLT